MSIVEISIGELEAATLSALKRQGYPTDEAATIAEILLYSQLRGGNQGVVKLIGGGMPRKPDAEPIRTVRETKLSALIDGGWNSGMVVMRHALQIVLEKAAAHGVGIVGTNRTNTSTGAIGWYARKAAEDGMIGLIFSGSGEYVAMHGSYEPTFGTNPLAIGIPSARDPIVFDMATSAIARFGIVEAKTARRSIPADVAYDTEGIPTTDPSAALAGAIRTFGGYKGAGLALVVEILTQPLVGTSPTAEGRKTDWGNLIIALDPELLVDREIFTRRVEALTRRVKAAKRLPGVSEILIPGERGDQILKATVERGTVTLDQELWESLRAAAEV